MRRLHRANIIDGYVKLRASLWRQCVNTDDPEEFDRLDAEITKVDGQIQQELIRQRDAHNKIHWT